MIIGVATGDKGFERRPPNIVDLNSSPSYSVDL
jgi:hypothetical protein